MILYVCKEKEQQPESEVEKMEIRLDTGVTVNLFDPFSFLSKKAYYMYRNSSYKIAKDEKNKYYVVLNNDIVCGPTNLEEVQEFFNDLYKLFVE